MKVLITGFEPWGRIKQNPSGEAVKILLKKPPNRIKLCGEVLPTEFKEAEKKIIAAVKREKPNFLIMTGLATGRKKISLEAIALNIDHSEYPDDSGEKRWRKPIKKGPIVLESRLPIDRLYQVLKRAHLPVTISYNAGTYICNHVHYVARYHFPSLESGFVHLPPRPMNKIVKALRLIINSL